MNYFNQVKTKTMQYTVEYFIKKFEAIPEKKWNSGNWSNGSGGFCVNGHCGCNAYQPETDESIAMNALFNTLTELTPTKAALHRFDFTPNKWGISVIINDGAAKEYQQPTPKQRILAALYDIKDMQSPVEEPKVKEIIRYVAVPETISESIPETIFN